MSLLDRVSTLLRANLNDLVEKAEDPERMLKQIVLDMENQLMQVKTQVAIAIADQHLLEKKRVEHEQESADWKRKAELAVSKGQDDLARAALERASALNPALNAFLQLLPDQVHAAARAQDARLARGESPGPASQLPSAHPRRRQSRTAGALRAGCSCSKTRPASHQTTTWA